MNPFIRTQLMIVSASVIVSSVLMFSSTVFAGPSFSPPDGNPAIDQSPQGPQGPQGNQGGQGPQGNQGPQGPQGPQGDVGYATCNFPGYGTYVSHGIDGGLAWSVGMSFSCIGGSRTWQFQIWGY